MNIEAQIEKVLDATMDQAEKAAARRDITVLQAMTEKASELRTLKEQLNAIEQRFQQITTGSSNGASVELPPVSRAVALQVSQGMINQNLLTLTDAVRRGVIRVGEKMVIQTLPGGDTFESELLANGNKLRERGRVGRFYREAEVRDGDIVVLREVTPGRWELRKGERHRRS